MTRVSEAGPVVDAGLGTIRTRSLVASRRFGLAAVLAAAGAALGVVAGAPWVVTVAGALSLGLGVLALRGPMWSGGTRGVVRCRDGALLVDGAILARADRIEYVMPLGPSALLVGAGGSEHEVIVGARAQEPVLRALREPDDAVTVRWRRHMRGLLSALGAIATVLAGTGIATDTLGDVPVLGGVVCTLLVMFAVWLAPRTDSVTIGNDGVAIRKAVERFVPLAEIVRASMPAPTRGARAAGPRELELELGDGARVRVEIADGDERLIEAVRSEIERRRARAVRGSSARGVLERLARDGRDAEAWASALAGLLEGDGGFRDTAVSEEDVLSVLKDVGAPAEARIGAAIALASHGSEHADLVREVAADVASPRLRVALDEAVRGETSDELVDAAVAEEEHAVGRAR